MCKVVKKSEKNNIVAKPIEKVRKKMKKNLKKKD